MITQTLTTELFACYSRIGEIFCVIKKIKEQLIEDEQSIDVLRDLNISLAKATQSIDRNTARVESINKTIEAINELL